MARRYEIIRKLGSGGMAEVYLARLVGDAGFEKLVAIKRVRPELSAEPESVEMFLREARLAAKLNHPNIVQVYDGGTDDNLYLVLEYVDGGDLDALGKRLREEQRRLSPAALAYVGQQLCEALAFLFALRDEAGVRVVEAHRDISSANVLISTAGAVKLGDFGVVRLRQSKTAFGKVRGKWEYFPPELVSGIHDERGDVWAVGVTLYKLAALQHPFAAATPPGHFERARSDEPAPLTHLPRALWAVLAKALAKDPLKRYQTAAELADAFDDFLCTSRERMSARRLSTQLFGAASGAAPSYAPPSQSEAAASSQSISDFPGEGDTLLERPLKPGDEEVKRFEEMFGPAGELTPSRLMPAGSAEPDPADEVSQVYTRLCALRAQAGLSAPVALPKFRDILEGHRRQLSAQYPLHRITFEVQIENGRPQVRPRAVPVKTGS